MSANRHWITVDEYHRMIEAGSLGEDDRVQLIAGAIVAMTPQGPAHALVIQNLNRLVAQGLPADLALRPQLPLTLPDDSEPEPDLAVVRLADARSREHHPRTALLVVEVPGDSLRLDRETKAAVYARAGIPGIPGQAPIEPRRSSPPMAPSRPRACRASDPRPTSALPRSARAPRR